MDTNSELQRALRQLESLGAPPAPMSAPTNTITPEQVAAAVESAIQKVMPQLFDMVTVIDAFFSRALPANELDAFKAYRDSGAPGLRELLASDKLHPVAQLLWDEIKSNTNGA